VNFPEVELGALAAAIRMGPFGSSIKKDRFVSDGVPVINGRHLHGVVLTDSAGYEYISEAHADELRNANARVGDVVITHRGTLGQASVIPSTAKYPRYVISQSQLFVRCDPGSLNPRFLAYFLNAPLGQRRILDFATQTGVPAIAQPSRAIAKVRVPVPELREQQAIAEVLGALDDKIAANTALAMAAERLAVAELSAVRESAPLGDLARLGKEQLPPPAFADQAVDHFSLPAFDADNLPGDESGSDIKSAKFAVRSPAVLLSKLNPRFPRIWRATPRSDRLAVASTEFLVLVPLNTSPAILWAALSQPAFIAALDARVAGTSGSHQRVRPADALTIDIVDPGSVPTSLRVLIESALAAADLHRWQNRTLAATRDALLPQLMAGKLRVRDAEKIAADAGV